MRTGRGWRVGMKDSIKIVLGRLKLFVVRPASACFSLEGSRWMLGSLGRDFLLFYYPLSEKGESRNRTRKLYRSEPNTLCFKG